jgi:hypothetical protein
VARVLIVANETIGGRGLLEAVRARAQEDTSFVICVPRGTPSHGNVIYDDAVYDAAQVRVDLARAFLREEGISAIGEVGDPDPYTATMDAVAEYAPREIIVSTHPMASSGWMRRDLVERIEQAAGVPVEHVVVDLEQEGLPFGVTLVVANRTASDEHLLEHLQSKARDESHLFVVIVPQEGGGGGAAQAARGRLGQMLDQLKGAGLLAAGMIADPDPYTATMNALQSFRVDDIVISTLPATRSGWLRANLIDRVRRATSCPVEHVISERPAHVGGAR